MGHHCSGAWPFIFLGNEVSILLQLAFTTWTVSFASSSYSGGLTFTIREFNISEVVAILGVSLYVLGFGLGCVCQRFLLLARIKQWL
jgi:hypothetical protein